MATKDISRRKIVRRTKPAPKGHVSSVLAAAKYLGLSRTLMASIVEAGKIPYVEYAPKVKQFALTDLDAFRESCKKGGK